MLLIQKCFLNILLFNRLSRWSYLLKRVLKGFKRDTQVFFSIPTYGKTFSNDFTYSKMFRNTFLILVHILRFFIDRILYFSCLFHWFLCVWYSLKRFLGSVDILGVVIINWVISDITNSKDQVNYSGDSVIPCHWDWDNLG